MSVYVANHEDDETHWVRRFEKSLENAGLLSPDIDALLASPYPSACICFVHVSVAALQRKWADFASKHMNCYVVYCSSKPVGAIGLRNAYGKGKANILAVEKEGEEFLSRNLDAFLLSVKVGRPDFSLFKASTFPEYTIAVYLMEKAGVAPSEDMKKLALSERNASEGSHEEVLKRYFS